MSVETSDNLSAMLHGIDDIRMEKNLPQPLGDNDVLIKIHSVGICGSDVHMWTHGRVGDYILRAPMVLGHESAGTVVKLGDKVKDLKLGDKVAMEPGVPCRMCEFCKTGRYNLCPHVTFASAPPVHGMLTRYFTHPADLCYKLPENVSYEEGAMLEPLSVAVHACRRAGIALGKRVLILGSGPIGLVCLMTAKAMGASTVVITDIDDSRLAMAKQLGADKCLNVKSGGTNEELLKSIEVLGGGLPDCTVECSAADASIHLGVLATKPGGCLMIVGLGKPEVSIPLVTAALREVDIRGNLRYANCYPTALRMITDGLVDVKPLITHRFTLEQSLEAFEMCKTGRDSCIKVMINCE